MQHVISTANTCYFQALVACEDALLSDHAEAMLSIGLSLSTAEKGNERQLYLLQGLKIGLHRTESLPENQGIMLDFGLSGAFFNNLAHFGTPFPGNPTPKTRNGPCQNTTGNGVLANSEAHIPCNPRRETTQRFSCGHIIYYVL